jgi:hypothetical protein
MSAAVDLPQSLPGLPLERDTSQPSKRRFWLFKRRDVERFGKLPRGIPSKPRRLRER